MEHILQLVRKRHLPGILILDCNGNLLYSNQEVPALFPDILGTDDTGNFCPCIPLEIQHLCERLRHPATGDGDMLPQVVECCHSLIIDGREQFFSSRAFSVGGVGENSTKGYIMVLIDRVVEKHAYDFEYISREFNFSAREMDVIRNLCHGLSNRAIAEKLNISEHTVKDHLKNIMAKMKVESRGAILASFHSRH